MTALRLGFYVLYVVLGLTIAARLLATGFHWELLTGVILGVLIATLGAYKIALFFRGRAAHR